MMIFGVEFVDQAVKLEKGVNELSFWWSWRATDNNKMRCRPLLLTCIFFCSPFQIFRALCEDTLRSVRS